MPDMIGKNAMKILLKCMKERSGCWTKSEVKADASEASYQIPQEVREEQTVFSYSMDCEAANKRPNKEFHKFGKLAAELVDAEGKGEAIKKRDNMVRQADANGLRPLPLVIFA
jgi:ribosomal protein S7